MTSDERERVRAVSSVRFLIVIAIVATAGCAGTLDCLRNERDFEAYVSRLNLRNMSMTDAVAALTADGYRCEKPQAQYFDPLPAIVCMKQCRPYWGDPDRYLYIGLDPSERIPGALWVRWGALVPA